MKYLRKILPVLLALLLLAGCTRTVPIKVTESTQPSTEATEPSTEPPTEPPTERPLSAEDIYYRCKFAAGGRASQYTTDTKINLRVGSAGVYIRTEMELTTKVTMNDDPCAVNTESELFYTMMDMEVEQNIREYYREEDGKLILYYDVEQMDVSGREELFLEDLTPYIIIARYAIYGHPQYRPADLALEPQTQMVDGREAYVITYTQSAMDLFGAASTEALDPQLNQVMIPTTWYVDKETFLTLEISYSLEDVDDLLASALIPHLNLYAYSTTEQETDLQITSFSFRCYDMNFDPVEVPEVPEDVISGAKEAAGYAAV